MSWKRLLGVFLLLVALVLVFLMVVKMPTSKTSRFPVANPVVVSYGSNNFQNITIEPLGKEDYHVDVWISPYDGQPMMLDFWAVNKTGFDMLAESLDYEVLRSEYPNKPPFSSIKAHAKEVNVTYSRRIELTNLDHNGTYCLVLVNFYEDSQSVAVTVEERHAIAPRTLLEPNLLGIVLSIAVAMLGMYLTVTGRRRSPKRARLH